MSDRACWAVWYACDGILVKSEDAEIKEDDADPSSCSDLLGIPNGELTPPL